MKSNPDQQFYDQVNVLDQSHIEFQVGIVSQYFNRYQRLLETHFSGKTAIRVLELGAGTCSLSLLISRLAFVGEISCCDISIERMKASLPFTATLVPCESSKLRFVQGNFGEALNFEDGYFDLIVFDGALHHTRSMWATLSECSRIMDGNGLLIAQREQYLGLLTAHLKLKQLLRTDEVRNGVSENAYLKEQYEYYFRATGFNVNFLPVAETLTQSLLLPFNGYLYSKWVILATKSPRCS
ncbi:MAG: class I SAM-dependent methyltransferase [Rhodocyclaceae bacterium]|nr:class I SAM-dependent methyltransferase [Rhodocyclaceae bacterium]